MPILDLVSAVSKAPLLGRWCWHDRGTHRLASWAAWAREGKLGSQK